MSPANLGRAGWRWCAVLLILVGVTVAGALGADQASAHAFLDRSTPAANAVVPEQPEEVRLWFTEPLEPSFTKANLYDSSGTLIETPASRIENDNELVLPLPDGLPRGTYTVQFANVSAADGHPQQGYLPFTIGDQSDIVVPASPEPYDFSQPPVWLSGIARWLALLGICAGVGGFACWLWVVRPAAAGLPEERRRLLGARTQRLALYGITISVVGSLLALVLQVWAGGNGFGPSAFYDVIFDTRYGRFWLMRVSLALLLAWALMLDEAWQETISPRLSAGLLALSGATLLPYALVSHAAAFPTGSNTAIVMDWIHLAASTIWLGGVATLLIVLIYGLRGVPRQQRHETYAVAVERFSTLAIASVIVLVVTGFYSAWLEVGNLYALRNTGYGQVLAIKLALIVVLLLLGFTNQRLIGPRLRKSAASGKQFGRAIAAETVVALGVLFAVGLLVGMPTAREVVRNRAERTTFHLDSGAVHAVVYLAPGSVGVNTYTVDLAIDGRPASDDVQLLMRFERNDEQSIEGIREVELTHVNGPRYQAEGAELSVVGEWDLTLIVRPPNVAETRFTRQLDVPKVPPASTIPGTPPTFSGALAPLSALFGALAVALIVIGLRRPPFGLSRMTVVSAGLALVLVAGAILWLTRDPANEASTTALSGHDLPAVAVILHESEGVHARQ
ncbi:MAG: copper resistance protein CopC/CopD [Thermomicrobiales bacterium]|nr:copper resistance protein CopC/CopD [Thermomicrobiales bacterium]